MHIDKKYSAIILSAGKSSRMGVHKFSLRFNNSSTFLENMVNEYNAFGCNEIIIVLNPDGASFLDQLKINLSSNVKIAINQHPEWERFYSLKLGARLLLKTDPAFVSNIDNPFINHSVLSLLAKHYKDADYLNPIYKGKGGHPFLISDKVIADLKLEELDQIHMKEFLGRYSKKSVEVNDERILLNVNTNKEYKRLFG